MAHQPRIRTIIVNYNAGDYLARCIRSLDASSVRTAVCVIDNASTDHSLNGLNLAGRVVVNQNNIGFPAACNQGARGAEEELLLFLNPDCFVAPDALAQLVSALDQHPDYAMMGAMIRSENGYEQRACRRNLPTVKRTFMTLTGLEQWADRWPWLSGINLIPLERNEVEDTQLEQVEAVSGALMLIRRSDFEAIGGFDESYFLHCEDLDLFQRLAAAGRLIGFVPQAEARHIKGVTQRSAPLRSQWYKHRNMLRFIRKFRLAGWIGQIALGAAVWTRFVALAPLLVWRSWRTAGHD